MDLVFKLFFRRVRKIAKSDYDLRHARLSHWTDFDETWYLRPFRKSVEKIQVSLKSDNKNE
jgi:hypothetical protein